MYTYVYNIHVYNIYTYVLLWLLLWIIPIILFQWGVMTIQSVQHVFLQPSNSSNHLFAVHHDSTAVLRKPVQPFSFLQMPRLSVEWSFQAWWCIGVMRLQKTKHYRHKQPDNIYIYIYICNLQSPVKQRWSWFICCCWFMILRRVRLWANQTWHRFGHPVTQDETEKNM